MEVCDRGVNYIGLWMLRQYLLMGSILDFSLYMRVDEKKNITRFILNLLCVRYYHNL